MSRNARRRSLGLAAIVGIMLLAGCGTPGSDADASGGEADPGPGVSAAAANLAEYESAGSVVTVDYPPIPEAAAQLSGKRIFYIPILTAPPLFKHQANTLKKAAAALDVDVTTCNGNSNPADITSCFNQADAAGAVGIITDSIPPGLAPQAYANVVKKEIPTIALNINMEIPPEYASFVAAFDRQEAFQSALTVDQIIRDSGGDARILLIGINDSPSTTNLVTYGIKPELAKNCPNCKLYEVNVNSGQIGSVPSFVATGLVQHPDVNYVFPQFDVLVQGTQQGVNQQQKGSSVKIVSVNGTPSVVSSIKSGSVFADTGNDINYEAWAAIDMLARMALGEDPHADEHGKQTPLRTYTQPTIGDLDISDPAFESGAWFGDATAYEDAFKALWGVR